MKIEILNKKSESVDLNEKVWGEEFYADVVAQAINIYLSNQRKGSAKAKTRSEVEGGGRKPWKQKGTGRARAGSIRSPLWVKGGAVFAPTGLQNFNRKSNKKANALAIRMTFSKALADSRLKVVDVKDITTTKEIRESLMKLVDMGKKTLIISDNKTLSLSLRNNENVSTMKTNSINVYELAANTNIIVDIESVEKIEKLLNV